MFILLGVHIDCCWKNSTGCFVPRSENKSIIPTGRKSSKLNRAFSGNLTLERLGSVPFFQRSDPDWNRLFHGAYPTHLCLKNKKGYKYSNVGLVLCSWLSESMLKVIRSEDGNSFLTGRYFYYKEMLHPIIPCLYYEIDVSPRLKWGRTQNLQVAVQRGWREEQCIPFMTCMLSLTWTNTQWWTTNMHASERATAKLSHPNNKKNATSSLLMWSIPRVPSCLESIDCSAERADRGD